MKENYILQKKSREEFLRRLFFKFLAVLNIMVSCAATAHSQGDAGVTVYDGDYRSVIKIESDYVVPMRFSNKITTVSAHAFFWKRHFKNVSVFIKAGITGTYAWGHSTQWYKISHALWQAFEYETSAFGAGPVLEIERALITSGKFSLQVEASAGCILYNNRFPHGGDVYNFMLRTGPTLRYDINRTYSLLAGYRWMHVSNGQGEGNQNPYYEAQGLTLGITIMR